MRRLILKTAAAVLAAFAIQTTSVAQTLQQQTWKVAVPTAEKSWFGELHKWWGSEENS